MGFDARRHEGWLYALAFLVALTMRTLQLGSAPLTDAEALPALQALQITQGLRPALAPHPAYILLTSVLFFLFGSTNFLARIVPALAGSFLVLAPVLFREQLKPRPAMILAFFLAVEPGLVALSRQAASSILALTFFVFAVGYALRNRPKTAGFFAGLAALSGPAVWAGLLGLAITVAIVKAMAGRLGRLAPTHRTAGKARTAGKRVGGTSGGETQPGTTSLAASPAALRSTATYFLGTLLLAGTLVFFVPSGLSAALAAPPEFLGGWGAGTGAPAWRLPLSLLVYQALALFLSALALLRGARTGNLRILALAVWLIAAMLVALLRPARQMGDLGWVLLPLWALAAIGIAPYTRIPLEERPAVLGVALGTLLLLVFFWFNLAGLALAPIPSADASIRMLVLAGALIFLAASLSLVGLGWSLRLARLGAMYGFVFGFSILTVAGGLGTAGLRGPASPELWWLPDRPAQASLLEATVSDLSRIASGQSNGLPVEISGVVSPALEWTLRLHGEGLTSPGQDAGLPPLIITPVQSDALLESSYRGQDFAWRQNPIWDSATPQSWLLWLTTRQMPSSGESIILWARTDLFLDARPSVPGS